MVTHRYQLYLKKHRSALYFCILKTHQDVTTEIENDTQSDSKQKEYID